MEKINLQRLVTPYQNKKLPIYRWYNYKHSFSRDLVWFLIDMFGLEKGHRILDPFCGSGTTLLAAKEKGISAIGTDILPLSLFISNAKVQRYNFKNIILSINRLKRCLSKKDFKNKCEMPNNEMLDKFFNKKILKHIFTIKKWINNLSSKKERLFFLTALLDILDEVSFSRKDGGFLRIVTHKQIPNPRRLFFKKINEMVNEIHNNSFYNNGVEAKAKFADARKLPFKNNSFDGVITSPPYLNRHDYTRVYILELAVGFMDSNDEIKRLRYKTLRSHVEARPLFASTEYKEPLELKRILNKLENVSLPNKQVIPMIKGYFEDMHLVLKELSRVVKSKGKISFVIGDSRYGGIIIPVSKIVSNIGAKLGLKIKRIIRARFRGNSPQQMSRFGKKPSAESIIIWEK